MGTRGGRYLFFLTIYSAVPSNADALRRQRLDLNFEMPEQTEFVEEDESSVDTSSSVQSLTPCNEDVLSESSFAKIAGKQSTTGYLLKM